MIEIQAPNLHTTGETSLFLAGGITGCHHWQRDFVPKLSGTRLVVLNPRRDEFDITNNLLEQQQIEWEFANIQLANAYAFWFCHETLCPITLFELGKISTYKEKPLFVGVHPEYKRVRDIKIQMLLERPGVEVVHSLDALAANVIDWWDHFS